MFENIGTIGRLIFWVFVLICPLVLFVIMLRRMHADDEHERQPAEEDSSRTLYKVYYRALNRPCHLTKYEVRNGRLVYARSGHDEDEPVGCLDLLRWTIQFHGEEHRMDRWEISQQDQTRMYLTFDRVMAQRLLSDSRAAVSFSSAGRNVS